MLFCKFILNKIRLKRKKRLKFYHFLILISGDIRLNPNPSKYLPDHDNKFESFRKRGLHFININVDGILPKIDELGDIVDRVC